MNTNSVSASSSAVVSTKGSSSALTSPGSGHVSECDNAMYYLALAALESFNCAEICQNDDKDALLKQSIQQQLMSTDGIGEKTQLIDFLKESLKNSGETGIMAWLEGYESNLKDIQAQIKQVADKYNLSYVDFEHQFDSDNKYEQKAANDYQSYENALQKAQNCETHWYEPWTFAEKGALYAYAGLWYGRYLEDKFNCSRFVKWFHGLNETNEVRAQKDGLEGNIKSILADGSYTSSDLQMLGDDFSQLQSILKGQTDISLNDDMSHYLDLANQAENENTFEGGFMKNDFVIAGYYVGNSFATLPNSLGFGSSGLAKEGDLISCVSYLGTTVDSGKNFLATLEKQGMNDSSFSIQLSQKDQIDLEGAVKGLEDMSEILGRIALAAKV